MKPYLIIIRDDVEPEIIGPFSSEESRLEAARNIRGEDPDKKHGIYRLEAEGNVEAGCFTGGALDIENEFSSQEMSHATSFLTGLPRCKTTAPGRDIGNV